MYKLKEIARRGPLKILGALMVAPIFIWISYVLCMIVFDRHPYAPFSKKEDIYFIEMANILCSGPELEFVFEDKYVQALKKIGIRQCEDEADKWRYRSIYAKEDSEKNMAKKKVDAIDNLFAIIGNRGGTALL